MNSTVPSAALPAVFTMFSAGATTSTAASSLAVTSGIPVRSLPRSSVGLATASARLITSATRLEATRVRVLVSPGATGPAIVPTTPSTSSVTVMSDR